MSTLGARALGLAVDGFPVLPLKPNSKVPIAEHGCKDASADPQVINSWWLRWPDANVGVATGHGRFVVDIDLKHGVDGEATWRALQQLHGAAPMTRTVVTPSGGRHLYFSTSAATIPCSVGRLGRGIDIRGTGGYAVAAGAINGQPYETLPDAIAPAPSWLLELVREPIVLRRSVAGWRELASRGVEDGKRNASIATFTGHVLRKGVDPWEVLELMRAWNEARCRPPLPDAEVVRCVNSIAGRELRTRQGRES